METAYPLVYTFSAEVVKEVLLLWRPSHHVLPLYLRCDGDGVINDAMLIGLPAAEEVGHCLQLATVAVDLLCVVNVAPSPHLVFA